MVMANLFAEKLELCVSEKMEQGLDKVNAKEMGEVVDMIKDSYEIEKLKAEKKYYDSVVNAMHEHNADESYYEDMGYPVRRDGMGRFMSGGRGYRRGYEAYAHRPEDMSRDMYWDDMGYNGGGSSGGGRGGNRGGSSSGGSSSRYGYSHDEYMEKRKEYPMSDPESAKQRKQLLNDYMDDLYDMAKDMVQDMSPEEKQMWKTKLAQITNM